MMSAGDVRVPRRITRQAYPSGYTRYMCGRFTLTAEDAAYVAERLGVELSLLFEEHYLPRWNIAPMQEHWIVTEAQEARAIRHATWGLVNWWDTSRREGAKHINARADALESRRPFREAFAAARCIIPADGFFEWTGEADQRRPTWFHRADREVFAFAGLYADARLRHEAGSSTTFTIITTEANALVGAIHDRMPVILPDEEAVGEWLYGRQSVERLRSLLRPARDDLLIAKAVSRRVNSVQHDDPLCLEPPGPDEGAQAALFA